MTGVTTLLGNFLYLERKRELKDVKMNSLRRNLLMSKCQDDFSDETVWKVSLSCVRPQKDASVSRSADQVAEPTTQQIP